MSFILDALKKADAERHLGELPGLHTTQAAPESVAAVTRPGWVRPVAGVAITILVIAGVALLRPGPQLERVALVPADAVAPVVAPAAPALTPSTASKLADPTPPVAANEVPAPPPQPVAQKPAPVPKPAVVATVPDAVKSAKPAKAETAAAESVNALTLSQLPPVIRSELPAMAVGGSMYSSNPADRMLLIDKRMLREGDEIAPGLLLESIQQKSAILRYKGYQFRLPL